MENNFCEIKKIIKFILKKQYRQDIEKLEMAGKIEYLNKCANASKRIMILQRDITTVGTFSDYIVFLRMIEQAIERNYIPIVDRKTIKNVFLKVDHDINGWECIFEQPMRIGLDDIDYSNSEVVLYHIPSAILPVSIMHSQDLKLVDFWRNFARQYIRLQPKIQDNVLEKAHELVLGKRVLGVSIREGYQKLAKLNIIEVKNHPKQVSIEKMLELVKRYLKEWKCDYVFFTCQTLETVNEFKSEFGERAFCLDKERVAYNDLVEGRDNLIKDKRENAYKKEYDYVTEICLLSRCTSFLCSENSGAEAAFIMSEGFEHFECINEGVY